MKKLVFISLLALSSVSVFSQEHFKELNFLIGKWQGVESGVAGDGIGFRTYEYDLNDHYIFLKNQSSFPISEQKPIGEVHRNVGIFSYNSNTSAIVLREFHVEGFTNVYELDRKLSSSEKLVFITREIENNPGNWKARSTINKISGDEFIETFEIAFDGENYKPFLKNHWHRVR
ncbi:hypothetical protein GWK08_05410 [Leptobacterium flavescens]|uniref:DUF1579 domain-containing protein n=1 Tax=Leptobacterium flavescens TaxID=472055 RepID=A0A6P0UIQ1_9FLAO|nr:hypothetical protein [Leptobacterium flavescens]NER12867.1 hypothetical protein [Leptobacterium flavescens]